MTCESQRTDVASCSPPCIGRSVSSRNRAPRETLDRELLRLALEQRVAEWRIVLRSNPRQGRVILQQPVAEIRLHSTDRPRWLATPRPSGLLVGLALPETIRQGLPLAA